jgi:hypothetical protein
MRTGHLAVSWHLLEFLGGNSTGARVRPPVCCPPAFGHPQRRGVFFLGGFWLDRVSSKPRISAREPSE